MTTPAKLDARIQTLDAREKLVQAANIHKINRHRQRPMLSIAALRTPRLFGPRQWQEALGVCRRFGLVGPDVIARAKGKVRE